MWKGKLFVLATLFWRGKCTGNLAREYNYVESGSKLLCYWRFWKKPALMYLQLIVKWKLCLAGMRSNCIWCIPKFWWITSGCKMQLVYIVFPNTSTIVLLCWYKNWKKNVMNREKGKKKNIYYIAQNRMYHVTYCANKLMFYFRKKSI